MPPSPTQAITRVYNAALEEAGVSDLDPATLTPAGSVAAKRSQGSTAPAEVAQALIDAKLILQQAGEAVS